MGVCVMSVDTKDLKMNDSEKIAELNKRMYEMEQKFYQIHSLAAALIEYENSDNKKANAVSNVSENIAETIRDIASNGASIVASREIIT